MEGVGEEGLDVRREDWVEGWGGCGGIEWVGSIWFLEEVE